MPGHAWTWPASDGAHTAASATGEGMDVFLRTSNTRNREQEAQARDPRGRAVPGLDSTVGNDSVNLPDTASRPGRQRAWNIARHG